MHLIEENESGSSQSKASAFSTLRSRHAPAPVEVGLRSLNTLQRLPDSPLNPANACIMSIRDTRPVCSLPRPLWAWVLGLTWLALLFPLEAFAQARPLEPLVLSQETRSRNAGEVAVFLEDPSGQMTLPDIQQAFDEGRFEKTEDELDFGFTRSAVWVRFDLENTQDQEQTIVLNSGYPLVDRIVFYELDAHGQYLTQRSLGDTLPFYDRVIQVRTFSYEVRIPAGQRKQIYVRATTTGSASIPIVAYTYRAFAEQLHNQSTVNGVFYGILFGLIFYNLFLFFSTRERQYVLYSVMAASNLGFALTSDGVGFIFWPESIHWQQIALYQFLCLISISGILFSTSILNAKLHCPRLNKFLFMWAMGFVGFGLVLAITSATVLFPVVLLSTLVSIVGVVSLGLIRMRQGYAPARIFLLAWSVMLFSAFFGVLSAMKVIGAYSMMPYFQKLGITTEMFFLSWALASRINMLKLAESNALQAAQVAQMQSQAKSEFLAKMSHEIRTPMNGVLGMTELLQGSTLNPSQTNYVRTIQTSGQALLGVINDILDYSKIEAGKMTVERREFCLEELLDDMECMFDNCASEKSLPLLIQLPPDVPTMMQGDETRLRQVLVNLLGNAFKFTAQGHITLRVARCTDNPGQIRFSVQDTGIGIEKDAQVTLFESFAQEDAAVTRQYGGTGLGLTICDQLVTLMGGSLRVDSQKGVGSTFYFSLPGVLASEPSPELSLGLSTEFPSSLPSLSQTLDLEHPDRSRHRLTLIAPQNLKAENLSTALVEWGFAVRSHTPQALLEGQVDLQSSTLLVLHEGLTKDQAQKCLQKARARSSAPVLVRLRSQEQELACDDATQTLVQPSGRRLFRRTLFSMLERGPLSSRDPIATGQALATASNYAHLKVLVAEDNLVNQAVIKGMLAKLGIKPELANNGAQAVQAFEQADPPFDLIFMDCEMPELDGYQATRRIRQHPKNKAHALKIFALTAHALEDHRNKALAAGMDRHLTKPVNLNAVSAALAQFDEDATEAA